MPTSMSLTPNGCRASAPATRQGRRLVAPGHANGENPDAAITLQRGRRYARMPVVRLLQLFAFLGLVDSSTISLLNLATATVSPPRDETPTCMCSIHFCLPFDRFIKRKCLKKSGYLMNKFIEMQLFVAVVDAGSMSEAARRLGMTKSVVSERIQQLEQRLGICLLVRGRKMSVTDPGQIFHAHCVRILADVGEAENAVLAAQASMRGQLRVAAPMAASVRYLGPMLAMFACKYPDLRMEIDSADRQVNMHDDNYDVAIRMGNLHDSSLIAKRMTINRHLICASPGYLAERGVPRLPGDLHEHEGLLYGNREPQSTWQLPAQGRVQSFRIRNRMRTDSGHQLLDAAKAGLGLAILPTFLAADAIASNELQIVMPAFSPSGGWVSAIYRKSHRASPKIHTLVNFLAEQIGHPPVWEQNIQEHLRAAGIDRSENPNY